MPKSLFLSSKLVALSLCPHKRSTLATAILRLARGDTSVSVRVVSHKARCAVEPLALLYPDPSEVMEVLLSDGSMSLEQSEVDEGRVLAEMQAMAGEAATLPLRSSDVLIWRGRQLATLTESEIISGMKVRAMRATEMLPGLGLLRCPRCRRALAGREPGFQLQRQEL